MKDKQFMLINKVPYLLHLVFDLGLYLAVRFFFGFEVALIFTLANIGCDIVRGMATILDELRPHASEVSSDLSNPKE